jgi:hypothetical protein
MTHKTATQMRAWGMEPACWIGKARLAASIGLPTAPYWSANYRNFASPSTTRVNSRALENVSPCLLELSRRAEDVKRKVAQAKMTTLSAHKRSLQQDNNVE